jgi:hypothetical protein
VPLLPALAILAAVIWIIGWAISVALCLRDEVALRRKDPERQVEFFPVWYITVGAFFAWWADLYLRLRGRRGRRSEER